MQKLNKFNQFLLEKYPTIWNTKIVWMLLAALAAHIIFFVIGYLSHIDPISLQKYSVKNDYFQDGVIFIHLIISILLLVGWLLMMFKNNAFKNFYPSSKGKLFGQFVQYFIIIFSCTTFYFSYMTGFRMFINNKYSDKEMAKNIDVINRAIPFLSQNIEDYTLENRLYPKPFYDLYCETNVDHAVRDKKYFVYYNRVYQFYTIYSKTSYKKDKKNQFIVPEPERSAKTPEAYSEQTENSKVFYFKKDVVDLSPYIKTTKPSYYNFSNLFYDYDFSNQYSYTDIDYDKDYPDFVLKKRKAIINEKTAKLLNKKNPAELEKLLTDFINISKEFRVKNNLDPKIWTKMIYTPNNSDFEVRYFFKDYEPGKDTDDGYSAVDEVQAAAMYADSAAATVDGDGRIVDDSLKIKAFNPEINKQLSPDQYFKNNLTNYYYKTESMKDLLKNVDSVKKEDFFSENIHIYLWIAFFLSTFIFSFRITGLKSLLFSVISAGVLVLSVVLLTVFYSFSLSGKEEYFASHLTLLVGLIILLIPLMMINRFRKLISSIFVNISMNGFVLFVFLIFAIITMYQRDACGGTVYNPETGEAYENCSTIMESLGLGLSYIILILGFVFMYFYTAILQKWKALPE